eukprot:1929905-Alexandrium_andersonii.AAC.1
MCIRDRAPNFVAFQALTAGHFGPALPACVFKARVIPDVARADRGPEMRSKAMEEFLSLIHI